MRVSDETLARSAQGGDRGAFEEIVRRYERRVCALANALVRDPGLAKEVFQETFARAWRSLASFDTQERLSPWLLKITANCSRDRWREPSHDTLEEGHVELEAKALSPLEHAIERERQEAVAEAVYSLPLALRQTVVLFYLDDLTYAEVGDILGVTPKAVGKRLHRAKQVLRARLGRKELCQ